ncbi:carbohydrate esterase family 3 protein [Xylariaceae sp. FL1651]|nr:carbohydrate esterase family 3 protein [Xylariaceae sp. FL1651]
MLPPTNHLCRILACATWLASGVARPSLIPPNNDLPEPRATNPGFANGIWLRIMPLGASITYGLKSSDGNGYRKDLRDMIVAYGNDVNMVGSRRNGTMEDNDVEGWPGYTVDQVHAKANTAVPEYRPNVILLNVGTNDCSGNVDIPNAGKRMSALLDDLYKNAPHATVILSTLLARSDTAAQNCVLDFNTQVKNMAAGQKSKGRRLVLVDMQPPAGPAVSELVDGIHPNDGGYNKMAKIWFNGIKEADKNGFLMAKEGDVPPRGVYG